MLANKANIGDIVRIYSIDVEIDYKGMYLGFMPDDSKFSPLNCNFRDIDSSFAFPGSDKVFIFKDNDIKYFYGFDIEVIKEYKE